MEKRHILNSPRLLEIKNARQKKRKKQTTVFLVCLFVFFVGLVFLSRLSVLRIYNITVTGNTVIDTKDILKVAGETMNGYYLFFIPKNNFVILPQKQMRENLEKNFPRLTDINIQISKDQTISISVAERGGSYTWCGESLNEGIRLEDTNCYFLDETGFIFDKAPYFSGDVYFRFMGELSNKEEILGQYFAKDYWQNFITLREFLLEMNFKPSLLVLNKDSDVEVFLEHENEPPASPKIVFNKNADMFGIIENLQSAVSAEPLKTELAEKYTKLDYIDLRFGNKIYYKFKNSKEIENISETVELKTEETPKPIE